MNGIVSAVMSGKHDKRLGATMIKALKSLGFILGFVLAVIVAGMLCFFFGVYRAGRLCLGYGWNLSVRPNDMDVIRERMAAE